MLNFEIVTPERRLLKLECETVTLPGSEGEFQVTEGHTPFLTKIKTGVVELSGANHIESESVEVLPEGSLRFMIADGYAEVDHDHVTVLCDAATLPSEVNRETESSELDRMRHELLEIQSKDSQEIRRLEAEIERSTARLTLI